ncbi:MAG: hypothetical protein J6Z11_09555 [Candidatus Riflebacteria bacterium]|nr:hypothetical protein [Candidatus Riflebacteria bacterium]
MAKQWHQLERLDHKALKKLQAEREKAAKLAAQKEKQQKAIIIAIVVLVVMISLISIGIVVKKKKDSDELNNAKAKLLFSNVVEYNGSVDFRKTGDWESLSANIKFDEDCYFRTLEESALTVQLQEDNQIKLFPLSEVMVKPPVLEAQEARITKQIVEMARGEVTCAISINGKGLLSIQVANITVVGQSGLFKIIYDDEKDKGQVVVKNGLVEVSVTGSGEKPTKLSGFYKVVFENGQLEKPTQASVIQYDWR